MIKPLAAIAATLALSTRIAFAGTVVLYNGLSQPSQTPAQQGWGYRQQISASPAPTVSATPSGTILGTGNIGNQAGYFKVAPFALNRSTGYSISFRVQINSEAHSRDSRAGFSFLVMSNSLSGEKQPLGIELGFWQSYIWAQSAVFTRVETMSFNTKSTANTYTLQVHGDRYRLFANGSATPILQGPLRQYTGYTPPPGYANPYTTPNLIFMGDNTTSATATVTLDRVSVIG